MIESIDRFIRPPQFDSSEYAALVDLRQLAEQNSLCEVPEQQRNLSLALLSKVDWAVKYTEYIPRNKEANALFVKLKEEVDRFVEYTQTKSNPTYCKLKLENILEQSVVIQKSLGNK